MCSVTVRPSDLAIRFEAQESTFVRINTSIRDSTIRHILVVHGRDHVAPCVHRDIPAEVIAIAHLALQVGRQPFAWRETAAGCDAARGHPNVIDEAVELLEHLSMRSPESFAHNQIPGYAMGVQYDGF